MEALDAIAKRYGVLPSMLMRESDPWVALSLDMWAASWGAQREMVEQKKQEWALKDRHRGGR